jgi:hypothetical protein
MSVSDMRDSFGREGRAFFQLTVLFSPDIALMSFVKWFEREMSPPCDFRWSAG